MLINPYVFAAAYDSSAQAYITAVETVDGQALETDVKDAINAFVVGCKADGIWTAIKASCILAGARTLAGALVPLVGAAPTNYLNRFTSSDYSRKTGLKGDGSKCLNSNRLNTSDPQDNRHLAVYATEAPSSDTRFYIGLDNASRNSLWSASNVVNYAMSEQIPNNTGQSSAAPTFIGARRISSASTSWVVNAASGTTSTSSLTRDSGNIAVFARFIDNSGTIGNFTNARLAFYSIGESLDLALLRSRVTTLINAIAAAIP